MLSFSVYFEPHLRRPVSQPSPAPFLGFPNLLTFKPSNVQTFRSFPPSLSSHQISAARLFSFTYEFPIFYPLCFDIHACNGGGVPPSQLSNLQTFRRSNLQTIHVFYFHIVTHCFAQWAQVNPCGINIFHALRSPWGVYSPPNVPTFQRGTIRAHLPHRSIALPKEDAILAIA
jgi:hypothetical protein